jgi:hypothetical protein
MINDYWLFTNDYFWLGPAGPRTVPLSGLRRAVLRYICHFYGDLYFNRFQNKTFKLFSLLAGGQNKASLYNCSNVHFWYENMSRCLLTVARYSFRDKQLKFFYFFSILFGAMFTFDWFLNTDFADFLTTKARRIWPQRTRRGLWPQPKKWNHEWTRINTKIGTTD